MPCDVQQFFPAIDHQILKDILGKTIADAQTLRLCEKIIDSGVGVLDGAYTMRYFPNDDLARSMGVSATELKQRIEQRRLNL